MGVCFACLRRPAKTYPESARAVVPSETAPTKETEPLVQSFSVLPSEPRRTEETAVPASLGDCIQGEEDDDNAESSSDTDESCPGEPVEAKWARAAKRQRKLAKERRRAAKANQHVEPNQFVSPAFGCVVSSFLGLHNLMAQLDKPGSFNRQCFLLANKVAFDDIYDLSINLGKGTFGRVEKCTHKLTNIVRAIKTIPKKNIYNNLKLTQEVDIMRLLEHPNIAKMYESFEDSKRIYIVMEICNGGELFHHISRQQNQGLPEAAVSHVMRQVSSAVHYMHRHSVAHRDLKPENFLLTKETEDLRTAHVKVIDFGFSTRFKPGTFMKTMASTPQYVAPEVIEGSYTNSCDIWSLGVIFYVFLSGAAPFFGSSEKEILSKVTAGTYDFNEPACWHHIRDISKELIKSILLTDPTLRLSMGGILQHPFLERQPADDVSLRTNGLWQRLESFQRLGIVRKAALTVLAQQLPDESVEQLRAVFVHLDDNLSGAISFQQLARLRIPDNDTDSYDACGAAHMPANIDSLIFDSMDTDGSAGLEYIEFLAATITQKHLDHISSRVAFRVFDLNGDGLVTEDKMATLLSSGTVCALYACPNELREDIEKTIKEADHDGDGRLNFEEFDAFLREACMRDLGQNLHDK